MKRLAIKSIVLLLAVLVITSCGDDSPPAKHAPFYRTVIERGSANLITVFNYNEQKKVNEIKKSQMTASANDSHIDYFYPEYNDMNKISSVRKKRVDANNETISEYTVIFNYSGSNINFTENGVACSYELNAQQRITKITIGGFVSETFEYDMGGRLTKRNYMNADQSKNESHTYLYDSNTGFISDSNFPSWFFFAVVKDYNGYINNIIKITSVVGAKNIETSYVYKYDGRFPTYADITEKEGSNSLVSRMKIEYAQ